MMVLLHQWNILFYLLTTAIATGKTFIGTEKDIIDAIVGEPFIIGTWSLDGSNLFITVKKGNDTILDMSLDENVAKDEIVQNGRMVLKYNYIIKKVFLMFENVSKEDGGLYKMTESFYGTKVAPHAIEANAYERKDGTWDLELNVFEPGEVKQGSVGANISMAFRNSSALFSVYNYDQKLANLAASTCVVLAYAHLYGRLRCTMDELDKIYMITIDNVTQKDAGLYKVTTGRDEYFFNITDEPTCAVVGENITIRWFYNQQGIKRTLRVIHPNQGAMMLLPLDNVTQINSYFKQRLLYSGDVAESFMLFTLLNVGQSDAGLYTIETLHGNIIPGSKQLIVETETSLHDVTTDKPYSKQETEKSQQTKRQYIANTSTSTVKFDTSSIMASHYAPTNSPNAQQSTVRTAEQNVDNTPLYATLAKASIGRNLSKGVPIDVVIPVVTATVGVILAMIGCQIWLQRKNRYTLKAVQRLVLEQFETTSFATPSTIRRPPPMPPREKEWTCCSTARSNALCNFVLSLPYAPIPTASTLVDTAWYSTLSLSDLENDKPSDNFILNLNGSNERTDEDTSVACDENADDIMLESCPSVCTSSIEKHTNNRIADGNAQRQVSESIQVLYAEVKKGPKCSSTNTSLLTTVGTDGLCGDGYEMVNISRDFDPNKTLKDDSKASESAKGQTPSCHGIPASRNEFVHGTNEDDGYESVETVINMRSAGNIKNEDAMATKDGEPKEQTKTPGNPYNDYADIDL